MLGAWIHSSVAPKRACQPQKSLRNTLAQTIQDVLDNDDSKGLFKTWTTFAKSEESWEKIFGDYFNKLRYGINVKDSE
jgi:hypothetical protein